MLLNKICCDCREDNQLPVQSRILSWGQLWGKLGREPLPRLQGASRGPGLVPAPSVPDTGHAGSSSSTSVLTLHLLHFSSWNLVFHFSEICETYALEGSQFFSQQEKNYSLRCKKPHEKVRSFFIMDLPGTTQQSPFLITLQCTFIGYKNGVMIHVPKPCLS